MKISRFFISIVTALITLLDLIENSLLPPPHKKVFEDLIKTLTIVINSCHAFYFSLLFRSQFVPYCTTKHIFKLGKNKFVRIGSLWALAQSGM